MPIKPETLDIIRKALAPKAPTAAEIATDAYGARLADMAMAAGYGAPRLYQCTWCGNVDAKAAGSLCHRRACIERH